MWMKFRHFFHLVDVESQQSLVFVENCNFTDKFLIKNGDKSFVGLLSLPTTRIYAMVYVFPTCAKLPVKPQFNIKSHQGHKFISSECETFTIYKP